MKSGYDGVSVFLHGHAVGLGLLSHSGCILYRPLAEVLWSLWRYDGTWRGYEHGVEACDVGSALNRDEYRAVGFDGEVLLLDAWIGSSCYGWCQPVNGKSLK